MTILCFPEVSYRSVDIDNECLSLTPPFLREASGESASLY